MAQPLKRMPRRRQKLQPAAAERISDCRRFRPGGGCSGRPTRRTFREICRNRSRFSAERFRHNYKLLHELSVQPGCARTARFVCVIAAAREGRLIRTFRGESRVNTPYPIGMRGFGYDPLFYVAQANKTLPR